MDRDLYEVLGVSKDASADDIKKAYRKLARQYHPDHNAGDTAAEERFKEISHAHDVLRDPEKRKQYDMGPMYGPGPGASGTAGFDMGDFDLRDIFGGMFGGGRAGGAGGPAGAAGAQAGRPRRGQDVQVDVTLSFDQAMSGATVPVTYEVDEACDECRGTGGTPGAKSTLCPECRGRGVIGRNLGGFEVLSQTCPVCHGAGTVVDTPCPKCEGQAVRHVRRTEQVKIPKGVKTGTKVRKRGKGQAVPGGTPGDLIVVTHVIPSKRFTRKGDNLEVAVPVTYAEAVLGAKVEVPTLNGRVAVTIPPGSQDGRALRVRGKGAPHVKGEGTGDLIARIHIQVPDRLTDEQREALEAYAKLDTSEPRKTLLS